MPDPGGHSGDATAVAIERMVHGGTSAGAKERIVSGDTSTSAKERMVHGDASTGAIELMVHGDDFGLSAAVNRGIWRSFEEGILTSASLIANAPALAEACRLAKGSNLTLGLHLNLTDGRPVLSAAEVPTLVDGRGEFPGKWGLVGRALQGRLAAQELEAEITAQWQRVAGFDVQCDHLDSHHHIHLLPAVAGIAAKVMKERGISRVRRVRGRGEYAGRLVRGLAGRAQQQCVALGSKVCDASYDDFFSADAFFGFGWFLSRDQAFTLRAVLNALQPGINEWMCHPADFTPGRALSRDAARRQRECDLLCAAETRHTLAKAGIKLNDGRIQEWKQAL